MDNELKPCPFCGEEAEMYETNEGCRVLCFGSGCIMNALKVQYTHEKFAIAAWNKRSGK